ncbi:hypothetical protein T06_10849 [Trichinella sp. T6]|nr:hypothetical protein T06_10849 [Trichinella sp. T6]
MYEAQWCTAQRSLQSCHKSSQVAAIFYYPYNFD